MQTVSVLQACLAQHLARHLARYLARHLAGYAIRYRCWTHADRCRSGPLVVVLLIVLLGVDLMVLCLPYRSFLRFESPPQPQQQHPSLGLLVSRMTIRRCRLSLLLLLLVQSRGSVRRVLE